MSDKIFDLLNKTNKKVIESLNGIFRWVDRLESDISKQQMSIDELSKSVDALKRVVNDHLTQGNKSICVNWDEADNEKDEGV